MRIGDLKGNSVGPAVRFERRLPVDAHVAAAVARKIWDNISGSGIARLVIQASQDAVKLDNGLAYDRIEFLSELTEEEGGKILVIPQIMPKVAQMDASHTNLSTGRPVMIELSRLAREGFRRAALVEKIWQGIDDDEILPLAYLHTIRQQEMIEGEIRGFTPQRKAQLEIKYGKERADSWLEGLDTKLKIAYLLAERIARPGTAIIDLSTENASLVIYSSRVIIINLF